MDNSSLELLNLMFEEGDTVCVSDSKYGYHSVPLKMACSDRIALISPNPEQEIQYVSHDKIILVSLNPIKGYRLDQNAYKYKNFLFELDYGSTEEQVKYFKTIGLPYSALIFSGNKSIHALVSLDICLPSEDVWRMFSEWGLAIASACDQNTKNPSRSIRLPGNIRPDTGKKQELIEWVGATKLADFAAWLAQHPDAKPRPPEKREISGTADFSKLKPWVKQRLAKGVVGFKSGRNKEWFAVACEFALAGYSEDEAFDILVEYFSPERDFKEREWKTSIKSGFKYVYARKN